MIPGNLYLLAGALMIIGGACCLALSRAGRLHDVPPTYREMAGLLVAARRGASGDATGGVEHLAGVVGGPGVVLVGGRVAVRHRVAQVAVTQVMRHKPYRVSFLRPD